MTDPDRQARRLAADRLRHRLLEDSRFSDKTKDLRTSIFSETIVAPICRMLADPAEKCRFSALNFVKATAEILDDTAVLLQHAVPVLRKRMAQANIIEPSEELRLNIVQLLCGPLLKKGGAFLEDYLEEIVPIILKGLDDPFHEVKKECCRLTVEIPSFVPHRACEAHVEQLLQSVVKNLAHPHFKVRCTLISAVDALMALKPEHKLVSKYVVPFLQEACFDKSLQIRGDIFDGLSKWLQLVGDDGDVAMEAEGDGVDSNGQARIPIYADILLPFFLLGMTDEDPGIKERTHEHLERVCQANAKRGCYNAMDADTSMGEAEAGQQPTADGKGRCLDSARRMVKQHLAEITVLCKRNVFEWTINKKMLAARLLHIVTLISRDDIIAHLDILIPVLCSGVGDQDEQFALMLVTCAHHVGEFCSPSAWLCFVLDLLNNAKNSGAQKANVLVVLSGLLHGGASPAQESASSKKVEKDLLIALASSLASEEIRGSDHAAVQVQLLCVVGNMLVTFGDQCAASSQELYHILLQLQACQGNVDVQGGAVGVTETLAKACGYPNTHSFASDHAKELLQALCNSQSTWDRDSSDQHVFSAIIFSCSCDILTNHLDEILNVFGSCVQRDRDPHVRLYMLKLLDRMLEDDRNGCFLQAPKQLLEQVLLPPAVWEAGKTAAAIRFHAMIALGTFFRKGLASQEVLSEMLGDNELQILPTIHSCMDEDYYADTRLSSCHTLENLLRVIGTQLTDDQKRLVYPELHKRLDDSSDPVRIQASVALEALIECLTPTYDDTNTGYLIKGLLIHMDDSNPAVQEAVCKVMEKLAKVKPGVVRASLLEVRDMHRGTQYIDRVLSKL